MRSYDGFYSTVPPGNERVQIRGLFQCKLKGKVFKVTYNDLVKKVKRKWYVQGTEEEEESQASGEDKEADVEDMLDEENVLKEELVEEDTLGGEEETREEVVKASLVLSLVEISPLFRRLRKALIWLSKVFLQHDGGFNN